jgi:probable phosphoglycerate mutase
MILHFVRHGKRSQPAGEFSNGLGKHPLTEKGRRQALELAQRLKGLPIAACYSSPILRAVQTAEILSTELGLSYQIAEALREFDVGILEGRSDEASWQQYSQLGNAWLAQREWEQRIEGGESFLDIQHRFVPFIEDLVKQYGASQSHILLVGHGGTYRCMLPLVLNNVDFAFASRHDLPNTAVVSAESTPQGLMCLQWGEEKFLVSVELHDRKLYGWLKGQGEPLVIIQTAQPEWVIEAIRKVVESTRG